jgi:hypothetical protein
MLTCGHIEPLWNINEFKELDYKFDKHKDRDYLNYLEKLGHSQDAMAMYNYFEPNPMPAGVYDHILPSFALTDASVAVNYFKPGQYIPTHVDLFSRYLELHNVTSQDIVRVIVMLEDSQPGQIIQICSDTIGKWKAGDWFGWDAEDPHAFYNLSEHDRYAIQITGTKLLTNSLLCV